MPDESTDEQPTDEQPTEKTDHRPGDWTATLQAYAANLYTSADEQEPRT